MKPTIIEMYCGLSKDQSNFNWMAFIGESILCNAARKWRVNYNDLENAQLHSCTTAQLHTCTGFCAILQGQGE